MNFLEYLFGKKQASASVARERLQIILAHERAQRGTPDYLPALKEELLAVIAKYVPINRADIKVSLGKQDQVEVLELEVFLPDAGKKEG